MKITLKDIAEETGYSISTVSRVLNGSKKISKQARREIYHTAKRLKYPLNRSLNGDKAINSLRVCFIITDFHGGELCTSMFKGMNTAAQSHNVQLSMISMQNSFDNIMDSIKELCEEKYDGLVIFAPEFNKNHYLTLRKALPANFPIISNALIESPVVSTVTFDGYSGGFLAGEHFHEQGYQKCGIIQGPLQKAVARYRFNGFRDYINQHVDMELCWQYQGNFSYESGIEAFASYDQLENKPQAIFACNDVMGHAFLGEALAKGYQVPEELALLGFDDLPICGRHHPTISSIHTDYKKLGMVTMENMKELLCNPNQEEGILSMVPVNLKQRMSS